MNTISFVFAGFLWALTLVLLPIIVHLFAFRKYKLVYFSDINLLKKITQTGKSKKQIKHWLILLLRCLMILFLVLAFSQPIQTNKLSSNSSKKLICIYIRKQAKGEIGLKATYFWIVFIYKIWILKCEPPNVPPRSQKHHLTLHVLRLDCKVVVMAPERPLLLLKRRTLKCFSTYIYIYIHIYLHV